MISTGETLSGVHPPCWHVVQGIAHGLYGQGQPVASWPGLTPLVCCECGVETWIDFAVQSYADAKDKHEQALTMRADSERRYASTVAKRARTTAGSRSSQAHTVTKENG